MAKKGRTAEAAASQTAAAASRSGWPRLVSRAPAADLAPWIGRLYAVRHEAAAGHLLCCSMFNHVAMLRVQLAGEWTLQTPTAAIQRESAVVFLGPTTRRMPVSVRGSFVTVGFSLRPGSAIALHGPRAADFLDGVALPEDIGPTADRLLERMKRTTEPEAWFSLLEARMRDWVTSRSTARPDPITTRFENMAFADPNVAISAFARDCGVTERTVERIVRRDFGMSPKQVLRRARALDMASHLLGVAAAAEAEELALRYYDQSHLIRDFQDLFAMSPRQFVATPQPLLTLALELRQLTRLEALDRLTPGEIRPWE